jgi:hypothetical protein
MSYTQQVGQLAFHSFAELGRGLLPQDGKGPDTRRGGSGGLGVGIYDRLIEQGHSRSLVNAVNFGGKPIEPPPIDETGKPGGGPANRRAELWMNLKAALSGRLDLPDSDSLQADLVSVGYKFQRDGRLLLEAKADMRKRGVPSPDEGDAVALCFCDPLGAPIRGTGFYRKLEIAGHDAYV